MDLYDKKISLITQLPPIYCIIEKDKLPKYPCYCCVKAYTWNIDIGDYKQVERLAYFNGTNFFYSNILDYDNTDWITEFRYAKYKEI